MRRTLSLAAALLALAALPAAAQEVRGTFADPASGDPIAGAQVFLIEPGGRVVATGRTGAGGSFVLRAPGAGTFVVRADRIGYARTLSPPLTLAAGQTLDYRLAANSGRIMLDALVVRADARCEVRPQEGRETAVLWEEARKALQGAEAAMAQRTYRFDARMYARRLDPRTGSVVADTARTLQRVSGPLWISAPIERLAAKGFMELQGDTAIFYAPDAAALLSDAFVDQHCLRVQAPPPGEEGLIGLAFEPVPGRRVPGIRGTMWLDRATAELRRMEYQYTGLRSRRPSEDAAGTLVFRRLPDGAWVVSRWRIRTPILAPDAAIRSGIPGEPGIPRTLADAERWRTVGLREEGGEITSIATRGGQALGVEAGATLAGVVFDSTRSAPLAGAQVRLDGTSHAATTDSLGRFTLRDLPEGTYRLTYSAPRLDSLEFRAPTLPVNIPRQGSVRQDLAVPSLARVLAGGCGPATRGVVVGQVRRDGSGEPLANARITAAWSGAGNTLQGRLAQTDARGYYRVCGAPTTVPVAVTVEAGGVSASASELRLGDAAPVRQDFEVAAAPPPAPQGGAAALRGRVALDGGRGPLVDAEVRFGPAGRVAKTDASGRFTLPPVPAGSYAVSITHPELGSRTTQVKLGANASDVDLRVPAAGAIVASVTNVVRLAGITATATARSGRLAEVGYYQRQRVGSGVYLGPEELTKRAGAPLTQILDQVPSVNLYTYRPFDEIAGPCAGAEEVRIVSRGGSRNDCSDAEAPTCFMEVYVDGLLVQPNTSRASLSIDRLIAAEEITAIEVYRGFASAPPQYSTRNSTCGVVLMWTGSREQ